MAACRPSARRKPCWVRCCSGLRRRPRSRSFPKEASPSHEREQVMSGTELQGARRSIRLHLIIGLAVVVVLAGGLGGWASTAQISGALIAPGSIVVESNVKKVQHPTGGVVGEVLARDGDLVKAGDVVVRLDDTVTKASLAIVTKNLDGFWARGARLQAAPPPPNTHAFPKTFPHRPAH